MIRVAVLIAVIGVASAQTVPCGVPTVKPTLSTKRIVGGTAAVQGSWPWMVLFSDDQGYISGAGAILGPRTIMTSAQMFKGVNYNFLASTDLSMWTVYTGSHNINTVAPLERNFTIKSVSIHENYDPTTLANDICLIYTDQDIVYNDHTSPVCLPGPGHSYNAGQTCYLAGWGDTGNVNDEVLFQVDLPIIADHDCQTHFQDFIVGTELCAGYENGGKDWCGDDIGSPLVCQDTNGAWYAQGIASSGGDCTAADEPGVFEDVSKYISWIKTQMQTAGYPYQY
ncbi:coagulation factor XI-like [Mya arenaria]|uniref:coagulation factor XI-like n=1 Tax=Mya arenaria TaxID=6604 RepID=UPI0022E75D6A|nr:coagulation factor XI-like [Mya arenaria]